VIPSLTILPTCGAVTNLQSSQVHPCSSTPSPSPPPRGAKCLVIVFSPYSCPNLLLTIFGLSKLRKPLDSVLEPGDGWVTTAGLFRVGNLMPEPWPGDVAVFSLLWSQCGSESRLELGDLFACGSYSRLMLGDLLASCSESLLELGDLLASCSESLLELGDLLASGSESLLELGDLLADRSEQGNGAVPNNSALRMDCHCGQCHNDGSESPLELGDLLELEDLLTCGSESLLELGDLLASGSESLLELRDLLARGSEYLLELDDLLTCGSEFLEGGSESLLKS